MRLQAEGGPHVHFELQQFRGPIGTLRGVWQINAAYFADRFELRVFGAQRTVIHTQHLQRRQ